MDPEMIVNSLPVLIGGAVMTIVAICLGFLFTRRQQPYLSEPKPQNLNPNFLKKLKERVIIDPSELKPLEEENLSAGGDAVKTSDILETDPLEYCEHLPAQIKRTQQKVAVKKIEEEMTEEQKMSERQAQRQQLEAIFKLMETESDKFGINSMDDMKNQMGLYSM